VKSAPELEPLLDPERLGAYLRTHMPDLQEPGELEIERHMAGHSNETFFVRWGPHEFVLRRPPRGAFLPTAHDVAREFRVLSALSGTSVRAPRPLLFCQDPGVIGAPFYLMERVTGVVIRDRLPQGVEEPAVRRRIGDELVDALVELHAVDWRSAGLEGFGKPSGYLERQIRRWKGQLELTEPLTRRVSELHRVHAWLERNLPDSAGPTIVHGDYKLDNVAFEIGERPRLSAILDWEMSTLGDPLADVGWMLSFWREPGDPPEFVMDEQTVTRQPGFASREELLDRYRERSGRRIHDLSFYLVLAVWKLAILLEGSYARHLGGMTDDPFFAYMEEGVPALARRALALTAS
jgi:aminoglycoside phosphotransferase (APT) family kinase protein